MTYNVFSGTLNPTHFTSLPASSWCIGLNVPALCRNMVLPNSTFVFHVNRLLDYLLIVIWYNINRLTYLLTPYISMCASLNLQTLLSGI